MKNQSHLNQILLVLGLIAGFMLLQISGYLSSPFVVVGLGIVYLAINLIHDARHNRLSVGRVSEYGLVAIIATIGMLSI